MRKRLNKDLNYTLVSYLVFQALSIRLSCSWQSPWGRKAQIVPQRRAAGASRLHTSNVRCLARRRSLLFSSESNDEDDDDEEYLQLDFQNRDWREFRARLVTQDDENATNATTTTTTWAYNSGDVIEEGSIILSQPQQDFCNGLQQQYFHKCAILVLEHDEQSFTRGIILNRPCDLILSDDDFMYEDGMPLDNMQTKNEWRVWFGGDVCGISSESPEMVCLHSLSHDAAKNISRQVLRSIQWTTFEGARKLVNDGVAESSDFWVFCGYCGWDAGQLTDELKRRDWYMVSADSQTLLKQLAKHGRDDDDIGEAGIDTWTMLMKMIGQSVPTEEDDFDDLMLREWAQEHLVYSVQGEESSDDEVAASVDFDSLSAFVKRAKEAEEGVLGNVGAGTLVRASPLHKSPFLLANQEFHKSLVLIIQDDDDITIGVLLNHVSKETVDLHVGDDTTLSIPQRYGGKYGVAGASEKPFVWLHNSKILRDEGIGLALGDTDGIFRCSPKDASAAIERGIAAPTDFIAVNGFTLWPKEADGGAGGMRGEIWQGNFEVVPDTKRQEIWSKLQAQELLTTMSFDKNLLLANAAWSIAGEGTTEMDEDVHVYKSSVKISTLCNDALRAWVSTFLLGMPTFLREEQSSEFG